MLIIIELTLRLIITNYKIVFLLGCIKLINSFSGTARYPPAAPAPLMLLTTVKKNYRRTPIAVFFKNKYRPHP